MSCYRIARFNTIPDAAWFLARKAREYQEHERIPESKMLFISQGKGGVRSIAARLAKQRLHFGLFSANPNGVAICHTSELADEGSPRPHCFALLSSQLRDHTVSFCRAIQGPTVESAHLAVCLNAHEDCDTLEFHLGADVSPLIESLDPGTVYFRKVDGAWSCYWPDRPTWLVPRLLVDICNCLCGRQRDFLERGVSYLAPLKQVEVAGDVGCHLSSVSRLIAGMEAQMEWGRLPLKSFFGGAIETESGFLSQTQAKAAVLQAIRDEDKNRPLSDDAITELLKSQGLRISRRTVTKYRLALGVPSTRDRAPALVRRLSSSSNS